MRYARRLRPGDLVEVRTPDEILETLDQAGAVDALPFMPEMAEFCGRRFRVSNRAVNVCFTGKFSSPRRFRNNDVVLLEDLRCSGAAHDDCQKSCMIFWRERWLRRVSESESSTKAAPESIQRLRARLKTMTGPTTYYCQSSEILKATDHLTRSARYAVCLLDVREGNCGVFEMIGRVARFAFWRMRLMFVGDYRLGNHTGGPEDALDLKPGELVEVKSKNEIVATLDQRGCHRGLLFMRGMRAFCGRQSRVKDRIDRIIVDGTGQMRRLRNTVQLENSFCGCTYQGLGGCSRREINYWRETWLRRSKQEG